MSKLKDLTNKRFGKLIALEKDSNTANGIALWKCKCDCGKYTVTRSTRLNNGSCRSCGCLRQEHCSIINKSHGLRNHYIYSIWRSIKKRCYNKTDKSYHLYGGRGIKIADEWLNDVTAFFDYIGERPTDKHQLNRKDNNGNYEQGNVHWTLPTYVKY